MKPIPARFADRYAKALRAYVHGGGTDKNSASAFGRSMGPGADRKITTAHAAARAAGLPGARPPAGRRAFERHAAEFLRGVLAQQAPPARVRGRGPRRLHYEIDRRKSAEAALRLCQRSQHLLLREAHDMREQVRRLAHKVIRAQEEERKEISRELHDEIVQTLASVNVQLAALKVEARSTSKDARRNISHTQRMVRNSVRVVYRFARELRPTMLDDLGLQAALESFAQALAKRTGIAVRVAVTGRLAGLPEDVRIVVYRVAQAALTNVAQHARATQARVVIRREGRALLLEITDNGTAFDAKRAMRPHRNQRLGLVGMRERVEMLDGTFGVESTPGRGTTVRANIPWPAARRSTRS
ncbi:MAG TPA: sensor histidine kinase [Opitutaceae bacterium]|nr:sensor histidine kinase [Opitutaceae bacterium]